MMLRRLNTLNVPIRTTSQQISIRRAFSHTTFVNQEAFKVENLYSQNRDELRKSITQVIAPILSTNDVSSVQLNQDLSLRFKVLTTCMQKFSREIPNNALPQINTGKDLVDWFVNSIESEQVKQQSAQQSAAPTNVTFVNQKVKKHEREENKKRAFDL